MVLTVRGAARGHVHSRLVGSIPRTNFAALLDTYNHWCQAFTTFHGGGTRAGFRQEQPVVAVGDTEIRTAARRVVQALNLWLNSPSPGFAPLRDRLIALAARSTEVAPLQLTVATDSEELHKLPWHEWSVLDEAGVEVVLAPLSYETINPIQASRENIRILAIFGSAGGLELRRDRAALKALVNKGAYLKLVKSPTPAQFHALLTDPLGWDMFFFAGHSASSGDERSGVLYLSENDSIQFADFKHAVGKARDLGLQLAFCNSCDGLGLARDLLELRLAQVVVFREPVPDLIAAKFFRSFVSAFVGLTEEPPLPLIAAVRQARSTLRALDGDFPTASWLPVLCQLPTVPELSWPQMVREPSPPAMVGLEVVAYRFIPFYLGKPMGCLDSVFLGKPAHQIKANFWLIPSSDGFAVAVLQQNIKAQDCCDFLIQRRNQHLHLISPESEVSKALLSLQKRPDSDALLDELPCALEYVMSIHALVNLAGKHRTEELHLLAEPSLLGITDEKEHLMPSALPTQSELNERIARSEINKVDGPSCRYWCTWANVVVEQFNNEYTDLNNLLSIEVQLQRLWYKLFLCTNRLERLVGDDALDKQRLHSIKRGVLKLKAEFTTFNRIDPMAATHTNELKKALIRTSRIEQVYIEFCEQAKLLENLEVML